MTNIIRGLFIILLITLLIGQAPTASQNTEATPEVTEPSPTPTETPTPTATPVVLTVTASEPTRMTSGSETNLTIFGTNFTSDTTVRLIGYGIISSSTVNETSIIAVVPRAMVAGTYTIEVSDLANGDAQSPNTLRIVAAPRATLPPTATRIPPTPMPGQPLLVVSNYRISPPSVRPGNAVALTITVVNQGSRTAQGVTAQLGSSSGFVPASTQATAFLPDMLPNASYTFTLNAIAVSDAPDGTNSIPLTMDYRDFEARTYSTQTALNATVEQVVEISQITLTNYFVNPQPVQPGEPVLITLVLMNTGSTMAQQAMLRVPVGTGVLLAGQQGSAFPLGDVAPGLEFSVDLPLIVDSDAPAGVQSQGLMFTYTENGTQQQSEASITLNVDSPLSSSLLFDSYDIGVESVQPGERFTLEGVFRNVGNGAVTDTFVSFQAPTSNSSTTTSSSFAPMGGGGVIYLDEIPPSADGVSFSQEFIVNGSVESGIYTLPIYLRYLQPDGTAAQETFNASIVVLVPPRVQFIENSPIPQQVRANRAFDINLTLLNTGQREINLLNAYIVTTNAEVLTEDAIRLQVLRPNEEQIIEASIVPASVGEATITIELVYLNDLNQEVEIAQEYRIGVLEPPPPPPTLPPVTQATQEPTFLTEEPPQEFELPQDWLGRLLLGLLGLGS